MTSDAPPPDGPDGDDAGRNLFRYVVGEEWLDYRAIVEVFAGTFFSEFSPDEVITRLAAADAPVDPDVVPARLESLRTWGNLTVSSSVGNPSSLADYYRRRNRYLITRAGQEVHGVVEGVLTRVDEVRDVSTSRLRALHEALDRLAAAEVTTIDPVALADLVRAVFDPHEAFTTEITQFFAAINQWQSRYDLSPEEFTFFAEVLVGYVAERLDEIERTARPIGRRLQTLAPSVPVIVERANRGLAARVETAGLEGSVAVSHQAGTRTDDWVLLGSWFVGETGRPSRIEQLSRDAVAAIRTLTLNLTRLSRVGVGASSRRADFLRLATFLDTGGPDAAPVIATAALGLGASNHYGVVACDADDPVSTVTSWWNAPRAPVPVTLRERGDTANRGRPSPVTDRSGAQHRVRLRREQEADAKRRVDAELLDAPLDGRTLSGPALSRLQELIGRTMHLLGTGAGAGPGTGAGSRTGHAERTDGAVTCHIDRTPGRDLTISSAEGTLVLGDLSVTLRLAHDLAPPELVGGEVTAEHSGSAEQDGAADVLMGGSDHRG